MTRTSPPPPPPLARPTNGAHPPSAPGPASTPRQRRPIALREAKPIAPKVVYNAVEGFGKTTLLAYAPSPLLLMAPNETGYDTLLGAGRVPQIPAYTVESFADTLNWIDQLIDDPEGVQTLGLDAMGGFERLCHELVCRRDFGGDWGEHGFASYQKGYDVALADWLRLLTKLEQLNTKHNVTIVMLAHSKVKKFQNPLGPDYDRYIADVHEKTWSVTAKWADAVFFGTFLQQIEQTKADKKAGKGKGVGGVDRVLYTERRDAWDAKNRYGCPPEILMPDVADQSWATLWLAITDPAAFTTTK